LKVLLVYPYFLEDRVHPEDVGVVPMGVYYIAAVLKEHGHRVEILNWHRIHKTPHKIEKTLVTKKPDVIAFSIVNANRWGAIEIARLAKRIDPEVTIVFGGIGATFLWEHLLRHFSEIDFVVTGEGEVSLPNLLRCIEEGDARGLEQIKGIAYRGPEKIVRTEAAPLIEDLDQLPMPAKYFDFNHVCSARGCAWNCTFCGSPRFWDHKVRFHSADYFVDQLELLHDRGICFFYVSDDTFTMKKQRVVEICKKILQRKLKIVWVAISRVDAVSDEILYWMRKAGCIQISYGVESGSEKIRKALGKSLTTAQIKRAFQLTTKYGILPRAYFIYGSPGENWSTIQESVDLIDEIRPLSIIFYILDIFPGTALYDDFRKRCGGDDDMWLSRIEDILYFETDARLSEDLILAFGERLRTHFYKHLPGYVEAIELVDRKDLYEMHSDFLSRLAMTFMHGDYVRIEAIEGKEKMAKRLYEKSLAYSPNHRAYLGLGIMKQRDGAYEESIRILSEGIVHFPQSESLNMSLGMSHMNLGEYESALCCFSKLPNSKEALFHTAVCYKALGDDEKEGEILKKLRVCGKTPG